ncbi:hypothetical protein K466DRAFT_568525 [Polyporus arcularius HHB13444]|uniref:Uncharacterized protein n=1 Tax=Polyporus arcularius HHB13444 TaxID=1314778 RepID=A0A5C3NYG6_9APHY|nr:hypothetical protein K466DRAFT_568525 [Polyporus arcularius HHB13444]
MDLPVMSDVFAPSEEEQARPYEEGLSLSAPTSPRSVRVPSLTHGLSDDSTSAVLTEVREGPPLLVYTYARYFPNASMRPKDPTTATFVSDELYYYLRVSRGQRIINRWLEVNSAWCKFQEVIQYSTTFDARPFPDMSKWLVGLRTWMRPQVPEARHYIRTRRRPGISTVGRLRSSTGIYGRCSGSNSGNIISPGHIDDFVWTVPGWREPQPCHFVVVRVEQNAHDIINAGGRRMQARTTRYQIDELEGGWDLTTLRAWVSTSLLYYLRLEDSGSKLDKLTIPLCINGFRGPEERVYNVILCASLAGWTEDRPYAQNIVDLLLLLRAMVGDHPAVSVAAIDSFRRQVVEITQYARTPEPRDQTQQFRELLVQVGQLVDIHAREFTEAEDVRAMQEVRDVWRVVSRGTQARGAMDEQDEAGDEVDGISATVKTALGIQRIPELMWEDPRLYATYTPDPRELEDIVLDESSPPIPMTHIAEPRVAVVMSYDPILSTRRFA